MLNKELIGKKYLKLLLEPLAEGLMLNGIVFNIDQLQWPDNSVQTVELSYKLEGHVFNMLISV